MSHQPPSAVALLTITLLSAPPTHAELFDRTAPVRQWAEFEASGYAHPVAGIVFSERDGVCAGMPLGGLGTGCIDIETSGVLGFSSIFFGGIGSVRKHLLCMGIIDPDRGRAGLKGAHHVTSRSLQDFSFA